MHAEREVLVKVVFPRLRALCEARGVVWSEIDRRWGITEDESKAGKVLPICLAEIDRCRPYFLGILGGRYGWVPDAVPTDLLDREPWLAERPGCSVTELEVWHGALNHPPPGSEAFFYLRDPDDAGEGQDARARLHALKQRIRDSPHWAPKDYADPRQLGERVERDLTALIERLFPADEVLDPRRQKSDAHDIFAALHARGFLGRESELDRLDRGDGPIIVSGLPGSGKTALLASWSRRTLRRRTGLEATPRNWFRREPPAPSAFILLCVGATPESTDWRAIVLRIVARVARPSLVTAARGEMVSPGPGVGRVAREPVGAPGLRAPSP